VRGPEQLAPAFSDVTQVKAQALYVIEDPVFFAHRDAILTMASRARLPTLHELRRFPEKGALMSYGPDLYNLFRRALLTSTASLRAPSPPICLWNSLFSDLRREVGGQSVSSSR
jgi:putative tryptophan/tyrosine transport system substrate-binding protein